MPICSVNTINRIMPKGIKPQDLKPVWSEMPNGTEKLAQELDQMATNARSSIDSGFGKFVDEEKLLKMINSELPFLDDADKVGLLDYSRMKNGFFSVDAFNVLKKMINALKNDDGTFVARNMCEILNLLKTDNGFDLKISKKVIDYIVQAKDKSLAVDSLTAVAGLENTIEVKRKLLDLSINWQKRFVKEFDFNEYYKPDKGIVIFKNYIKPDLPVSEQLARIESLSKITNNIAEINPLIDIVRTAEWTHNPVSHQLCELVDEFFKSKVLPTKAVANVFLTQHPDTIREFFNCVKPLTSLDVDFVELNEYALRKIVMLKDNAKLDKVRSLVKAQKDTKGKSLIVRGGTINTSLYTVTLSNSAGYKSFRYDKVTDELSETVVAKTADKVTTIESRNFVNNKIVSHQFDVNNEFIGETITQMDSKGKIKFKEFTIPSNVPGQYDVYRQMPDGKIIVKAKAFRDPVTGEYRMVRNLTSPSGVKSKINYSESNDGSYTYDYVIKNKEGQIIDETHVKYSVIDENHFVSEVNGIRYNVERNQYGILVTPEGKCTTLLNFKELIKEYDPAIVSTVLRLPGDELLNLKNLYVNISKSENAFNANTETLRRGIPMASGDIYIGDYFKDSANVFLHELGHLKFKRLKDSELEEIKTVFEKELAAYKKVSCGADERLVGYLIDTEHYLNDRDGAIEEAIADILAMRRVPMDKDADVAIRNLKFSEAFPETVACVNKIFDNKLL